MTEHPGRSAVDVSAPVATPRGAEPPTLLGLAAWFFGSALATAGLIAGAVLIAKKVTR